MHIYDIYACIYAYIYVLYIIYIYIDLHTEYIKEF